jgi:hypothetical protein
LMSLTNKNTSIAADLQEERGRPTVRLRNEVAGYSQGVFFNLVQRSD